MFKITNPSVNSSHFMFYFIHALCLLSACRHTTLKSADRRAIDVAFGPFDKIQFNQQPDTTHENNVRKQARSRIYVFQSYKSRAQLNIQVV